MVKCGPREKKIKIGEPELCEPKNVVKKIRKKVHIILVHGLI